MNRRVLFLSIVVGLAILGLVIMLLENPFSLVKMLFGILIFVGVIFLLFNFVLNKSTSTPEMRKYKKALKQSRERYSNVNDKKTKRKLPSYLRVIDGNKGK